MKTASIDAKRSSKPEQNEHDEDTESEDSRFTPVQTYWLPIIESLVELGGRSKKEGVVESVGKKLQGVLTPADKEFLPSGLDVRWKNRVAWQRLNMVNQGLLRSDSPRGVWEITDSGRSGWSSRSRHCLLWN